MTETKRTPMQRLLYAAGWDAGSIRHKQLQAGLDGAGLTIVELGHASGGYADEMSMRDYFAGQALIGLLHPGWEANAVNKPDLPATEAYRLADAMLAARAPSNDGGRHGGRQ